MNGHHLILGKLKDYLTGEILEDTHDERYRQAVVRHLVEKKAYQRSEIQPRRNVLVAANAKKAMIQVAFVVHLKTRNSMVVQYAPGSLVTRRRSTLAVSRLLSKYPVPIVVITNGEDAEIMDGESGERIGSGLGAIPSRRQLLNIMGSFSWRPMSPERIGMESRIAYAFDVDGSCPCDDTICKLQDRE